MGYNQPLLPNECLHDKQRVIQDQFGRWTKSLTDLETKQTAAKYRNVGKRVLDMRILCFLGSYC